MKALVYGGPGRKALEDRPKPQILEPGDAAVFGAWLSWASFQE